MLVLPVRLPVRLLVQFLVQLPVRLQLRMNSPTLVVIEAAPSSKVKYVVDFIIYIPSSLHAKPIH
jgi:hypothetical protein